MLAFYYLSLTLLMTVLLLLTLFKAINRSTEDLNLRKSAKTKLLVGFLIWHLYTYLIATSGILQSFEFPPRFALFLIVPLFLFTGIFLYNQRSKRWIQEISITWLTSIQSFRILVETIFVLSVAQGVLHVEATIEGYNYDMVFAVTAFIIGLGLVFKKISLKVVLWWNYTGLLILFSVIFVFVSTIYFPGLYGYENTPAPLDLTKYPYVLVAGFLMPMAVFIHVLSIVQIKNSKSFKRT